MNSSSAVTSVSMNTANSILGAANVKGDINLFPMNDLVTRTDSEVISSQTYIGELYTLKASDAKINQMRFTPHK